MPTEFRLVCFCLCCLLVTENTHLSLLFGTNPQGKVVERQEGTNRVVNAKKSSKLKK